MRKQMMNVRNGIRDNTVPNKRGSISIAGTAVLIFCLASSSELPAGELHDAATYGQVEQVRQILEGNSELLESKNPLGNTPLIIAAWKGHLGLVELLLEMGADVNEQNSYGNSALHLARDVPVIKSLIRHGANPNVTNQLGSTPLHFLTLFEDTEEEIRLLIESGANVNALDGESLTPLLHAVLERHIGVADVLVSNGAELDVFSAAALGPLHELKRLVESNPQLLAHTEGKSEANLLYIACAWGNLDTAGYLLASGIDVNTELEGIGATALIPAVRFRYSDIVDLLLRQGAYPNIKMRDGRTALHVCGETGGEEIARLLVEASATINVQDELGWTPLHKAVDSGHEEVVRVLLANGAKVNAKMYSGDYALHYAVGHGREDLVDLLLDAGAKVNVRGEGGNTPLHYAARYGVRVPLAKRLISEGAKVDAKNFRGNTPLHLAVKSRSTELMNLLLDEGADVNAWSWIGETPLVTANQQISNGELIRILAAHGGREYSAGYRTLLGLILTAVVSLLVWALKRYERKLGEGI